MREGCALVPIRVPSEIVIPQKNAFAIGGSVLQIVLSNLVLFLLSTCVWNLASLGMINKVCRGI